MPRWPQQLIEAVATTSRWKAIDGAAMTSTTDPGATPTARAAAQSPGPSRLPPVPDDAPVPTPPRSERRPGWRRLWHQGACQFNRAVAALPGTRQYYESYLRRRLQWPAIEVPLARGAASGQAVNSQPLRGLRIAVLSDLHAGSYLGAAALEQLADEVVARAPDLICLPGDLINSRAAELETLGPFLRALRAPLGVFAAPGNHDHTWCNGIHRWRNAIEAHGVQVMINRGTRLHFGGATLWLAGVDDYAEGVVDLTKALRDRREGEPCVLMAHQPDYFAVSLRADIDLTVAGHTHGGQVRLGRWIPVRHSQLGFDGGHYTVAQRHLVVSRGIGATLLPLRVGATPEVPLIELC